ncbi:hypothetical protein ABW19_dt0209186 [Dactylella cylindrospora]|nr:hypothetical protein ABW19_dt0209186 [Dactylella cylindrospora]
MTSLLLAPATFTDDLRRGQESFDCDLPFDKNLAYDWIVRRYLERVSDGIPAHQLSNKKEISYATLLSDERDILPRIPSKRLFQEFTEDSSNMSDRRSSRRIASQPSAPPPTTQSQPHHSRGTRANARKEEPSDTIVVAPPSLRTHSRAASTENAKAPLPKSSSNIRSVPASRSTRTSSAANTRSQPVRSSGRSQPTRAAATAGTRSRRRLPSSDSEDEESNIDIADDDDIEASQSSSEEEDEEEEEEEPVPKRTTRGAATRQRPPRRAAKAIPSEDEDAPGETDDGMDVDETIPVAAPVPVRAKIPIASDEDAEGEPDDEQMGVTVTSAPQPRKAAAPIPVPAVISPSDDSEESDDLDEDDEEEEEEEDEEDDEDMEDSAGGLGTTPDISRPDTPDLTRLTRRQKGRYNDGYSSELLELPDDFGSTKKSAPLSAAEQASRRAEMARRRKNQSEQRREEEKMETINKLLKKQATKVNRRSQKQLVDDADDAVEAATPEPEEAPTMIRWISSSKGFVLGVPQPWLDAPIGEVYQQQDVAWRRGGKRIGLVEELPDQVMADA